MYKLVLAWRYLRSRYIALASIISVTLGVATLIVVNSVMAGFSQELHDRLHGIMSDIVIESHDELGIQNPAWHIEEIRKLLGDDVEAVTKVVHVPAMLNYPFRGRWQMRQINLMGIEAENYGKVSDFAQYLTHPDNREELKFLLRRGGYGPDREGGMPNAGWRYRQQQARARQFMREAEQHEAAKAATLANGPQEPAAPRATAEPDAGGTTFLEVKPPADFAGQPDGGFQLDNPAAQEPAQPGSADPDTSSDPFSANLSELHNNTFDPMKHQHTGVVLGIAICSQKFRDAETNEAKEIFTCRPGDDVQITFPSIGTPPTPTHSQFTVVDLYESKMNEYDEHLAFVPLKRLQYLRGMGDSVTTLSLKLKPGVNLEEARNRLQQRFPPTHFPLMIQTWRDLRAPLLSAVQLETTILNILLFLIIAVAGFGILATFYMIVVEKTKDIGVLKALGAPSGGVMSIFLSYGLSLGIVGSGVGAVLGLLFVANINEIASVLEWVSGREVFDQTVYYFQEIPTRVETLTVVLVALGATLIAVLASVLPARQAARLHPVEALRYE